MSSKSNLRNQEHIKGMKGKIAGIARQLHYNKIKGQQLKTYAVNQ